MCANSYEMPFKMRAGTEAERIVRLDSTRRLLAALVAHDYDERAGSLAGLLTLGPVWLKQQQLAALAWVRLKRACALPGDLAIDLRRTYYAAVGDAELHRQELIGVLWALNAAGVAPVLFKGAALAFSVYPDPATRLMGDLDFWVMAEAMPAAQAALEEYGYRPRFKPTRPLAFMIQSNNELPLHGTRPGQGLIELHWSVFPGEWLRRTASIDEVAIRSRVQPVTVLDQRMLQLAPEDALIQLAIHASVNHQMSLAALRSLMDITLLARHSPLNLSVIVQRARDWRVATATWLVLSLTVDLAGLGEAAGAVRQLQPSALRRRMIHTFANAETLVEMRDLSSSKWRYVFLLLLVDRPRDAVKLIYRALWPEREWLIARYGRYTFSTRLRHLLDAARGRI